LLLLTANGGDGAFGPRVGVVSVLVLRKSQPQQQPPYQVAARWRAEFFFQNSTQYISGTIISIVFVCLIRRLDRPFYKDKLNVTL
jgi:hypothetical protein